MSKDRLCYTYLIAIAELQQDNLKVKSIDVAKNLGCTRASVNYAIGKLRESGYVNHERYKQISLTEKGNQYVQDISQTRRLLQRYLQETLHINGEIALAQAKAFETEVHDDVLARIRQMLI